MPIYEYVCLDCPQGADGSRRRVSLLWRSMAEALSRAPVCPRCGGSNLQRLMSRVAVLHSEESRLDDLADPASLQGLDESDPKSLARWMRKMSGETGEELGPEFDEVIGRLEAGEDPESIEKSMPDLAEGGDDFGVM